MRPVEGEAFVELGEPGVPARRVHCEGHGPATIEPQFMLGPGARAWRNDR